MTNNQSALPFSHWPSANVNGNHKNTNLNILITTNLLLWPLYYFFFTSTSLEDDQQLIFPFTLPKIFPELSPLQKKIKICIFAVIKTTFMYRWIWKLKQINYSALNSEILFVNGATERLKFHLTPDAKWGPPLETAPHKTHKAAWHLQKKYLKPLITWEKNNFKMF